MAVASPFVGTLEFNHYDGTTETLTFHKNLGPDKEEDYFIEVEAIEGDEARRRLVEEFIADRRGWLVVAQTDRGRDNGRGHLYWSERGRCINAQDSWEEINYAWNVARDADHVVELWGVYTHLCSIESPTRVRDPDRSGFVDWLINRTDFATNYFDLGFEDGPDPFEGCPVRS